MADKTSRSTKDEVEPRAKQKETYDLLIAKADAEKAEAEDLDVERELANEEHFDTQHSDGHTLNPHLAQEQGLTYTPPTDPPVQASDDPQGAEIAAGFAPSMEDTNPDAEILPATVDNNDLDLLDDIYVALRYNSETAHLNNIKVQVKDGVVNLLGTVSSEEDIVQVYEVVNRLAGVVRIKNNLVSAPSRFD